MALPLKSEANKKHNGSPSPREFGLRLIKFQVNTSEFTRRGGAYFIFKNLK